MSEVLDKLEELKALLEPLEKPYREVVGCVELTEELYDALKEAPEALKREAAHLFAHKLATPVKMRDLIERAKT